MPRKGWLTLVAFLVISFGILFGGPKLTAFLFRKYKEKIDKNGAIVHAQVYLKKLTKVNLLILDITIKIGCIRTMSKVPVFLRPLKSETLLPF